MMVKVPNMRLAPISVCVLLVLSACGQPPRVMLYEERQGGQATHSVPANGVHIVAVNDSLYGVSRRYGVSTRSIIGANRLQPPYRLIVGQRLKLPRPRIHRVVRGDTLYGISRQYGVAMSKLASLNDLKSVDIKIFFIFLSTFSIFKLKLFLKKSTNSFKTLSLL